MMGKRLDGDGNVDDMVLLDADYVDRGDTFAMRIKADTRGMQDMGFRTGDVVFCRVDPEAIEGCSLDDIVAFVPVGGDATVAFVKDCEHLPVDKCLGKVVGMFRRL